MKTSIVIVALAAAASASPTWREKHDDHDDSWDGHDGSWGKDDDASPFTFTSTYNVIATPDQVVNATNAFTGGLAGAKGYFNYGINSHENVICYNITLTNFRGNYSSPATTATHIHEAAPGKAGPPRIAFPNPMGAGTTRNSIGCLRGPFKTGVLANGTDTGDGFHVSKIENSPEAFFTDVHSSLAVPGAVRGQLDSGCK